MSTKLSKEEVKEISLIKAHYIAILEEKRSLNAHTINDVNRLCDLITIYKNLVKDINKRGVNLGYNNGGGQCGTKQNDSVKMLGVYEDNIEKLKKEINNYEDVNGTQYNTYDFRKYESYFLDDAITNEKINEEEQYKELCIIDYCKNNGIPENIGKKYFNNLRSGKTTHKKVIEDLKVYAYRINNAKESYGKDYEDDLLSAYMLRKYKKENDEESLNEFINRNKLTNEDVYRLTEDKEYLSILKFDDFDKFYKESDDIDLIKMADDIGCKIEDGFKYVDDYVHLWAQIKMNEHIDKYS